MNKVNNKNLYYIGGAAALGLLFLYYKRSTTKTPFKGSASNVTETR